jgi:Major tropism determinant N-terminal domain
MAVLFQLRRGTAAEWTAVNPVLAEGELAYETDTDKMKVGDGTTNWIGLPYTSSGGGNGGGDGGNGTDIHPFLLVGM